MREAREAMEAERVRVWEETLTNVQQAREAMPEPERRRSRQSLTASVLRLKARGLSDKEIASELREDPNVVTAVREMHAIECNWLEAERLKSTPQSYERPLLDMRTVNPRSITSESWGGTRAHNVPEDLRRR
ncbi:hypothetical protein MRQ47_004429 [Salmonella enterica]|nr:hypothetical protein [Salmonella enterica]